MKILFIARTFLLSILAVFATQAVSAPVITDIDYSNPTEIIVTGNNFGAGPHVVLFENFEKDNKFANLLSGKSSDWRKDVVTYRESSGNHVHRANNPITSKIAQIVVEFQKSYTEAFISFSVKTPQGTDFPAALTPRTFPGASSWKFTWLMSGKDGYNSSSKFDICLPTHTGGGIFLLAGNDGNLARLDKGPLWWDWDSYNHMSSYIKLGSEHVDYSWTVTNTVTNREQSGTAPASIYAKTDYSFDRINIPGWWRNTEGSNFDGLYDNLYVAVGDNALARAVITDDPILAKSTVSITVMAKSWSNNRLVFDADTIPTDKTYYLHIFDRTEKKSAAPIKVCPRCPKML